MLCGKRLSCLGGASLKDDGRSLWARLAQMWTGDIEVFALMVDFSDPAGIGVDSAFAIENNSIVTPGRLPEFVSYSHVFFRDSISVVVLISLDQASGARLDVTYLWLLGMA
jgi:hypothetical protein